MLDLLPIKIEILNDKRKVGLKENKILDFECYVLKGIVFNLTVAL